VPRHPDTVVAPNTALRYARERRPSPRRIGQYMSRSELADAVNAALDSLFSPRDLQAEYVDFRWIGKLERGEHRWPSAERRAALRYVLGATEDADLDLYSPRRSGAAVAGPSVGSWDETIHHLRLRWRLLVQTDKLFGPRYALIGVTEQLTLVDRLLFDVPDSFRSCLIRVAAQYAESAAWLNQQLDECATAQHWTAKSLGWAAQSLDPTMTAWARYRSSQHWLLNGQPRQAVERAASSLTLDSKLPGPMRAALRVQSAHAIAATGGHREAMGLLDEAHRWATDRSHGKPEGDHGSYCTSGYIEVHRGTCLRLAQRPDEAIAVLNAALLSIPSLHRQDFASALLSKAAAHLAARQPDLAAATAREALPIARQAGSRRILHRIGEIGTAVSEHRHLAHVDALLGELAEMS
jgi:tetratricopeptide (TPR) repeat protein